MSAKIAELKARSKASPDKKQWVVVYGRIETKEELLTVDGRDGKPRPAGYGHLGGAPAQIVCREKDRVFLPRDVR